MSWVSILRNWIQVFFTLASVIGVSDMDGALDAAKIMLKDGIQLIELCGGFSEEVAAQVRLSIGERVPVGVVVYDAKSLAEIQKLFG
jgi:hypothetical protein